MRLQHKFCQCFTIHCSTLLGQAARLCQGCCCTSSCYSHPDIALLAAIPLNFKFWVNETEQSLLSLAAQLAKMTVPTLAGTEIDACVLWRKKAPVVLGEKGKHRDSGNGG